MAVLLDTASLPINERYDAFDAALNSAVFPSHVELLPGKDGQPNARMELWQLGRGVDVVRTVTTGHVMRRTNVQIRKAAPERLSLAMVSRGAIAVEQGARRYESRHTVQAIEAMSPYHARFSSDGLQQSTAMCTQLDLDRLGLRVDVVRAALPNIADSPLYELFRRHLAGLVPAAKAVEDTPAAALLGSATSELVRALLASAAPDSRWAQQSIAAMLVAQIDAYIETNLDIRGLTADRIAAAHNISVRYLYRLFAGRERTLEQQIIHVRLEHARKELTYTRVEIEPSRQSPPEQASHTPNSSHAGSERPTA